MTIRAEVHADNFAATAKFDATPFFKEATPEQIVELASCGWGGDYAADRVFLDCSTEPGYESLLDIMDATGREVGFECHVHEPDALGWLKEHRNDVFLAVCAAEELSTDTPYGDERAPHWDSDPSWKGGYAELQAAPAP